MFMNCENVSDQLFDYVEGTLNPGEAAHIRAHLEGCDDCGERYNQISAVTLSASYWRDEEVPRWREARAFAAPSAPRWALHVQLYAAAASVIVLILVLLQVRVDNTAGFALSYADAVSVEDLRSLEQDVLYVNATRHSQIQSDLAELNLRQRTANQHLARTLIETSRVERREDLSYLLDLIEEGQAARDARTGARVAQLLREQRADKERVALLLKSLASADQERLTLLLQSLADPSDFPGGDTL